ncbi:type II toxin-antitoxin system HicB family antitoxin [Bacillus manliponensis]|uniref:type II toxin-antitoxin system HicB family antitoxin n=1 Tax=Bacillus manliponensis TaxID=574376 RepID=UPI0035165F58
MGEIINFHKDYYTYPAIFHYADDGISIGFPDLPGCLTCADTDIEAMYMARDVLGGFLVGFEDDNTPMPKPTPLREVKVEENEQAVLIDVWMPPVREQVQYAYKRISVSIPVGLHIEAKRNNINISKLLQHALNEKLGTKYNANSHNYKTYGDKDGKFRF